MAIPFVDGKEMFYKTSFPINDELQCLLAILVGLKYLQLRF